MSLLLALLPSEQYLRPDADLVTTGWTHTGAIDLYLEVAEATANDATYATITDGTAANPLHLRLANPVGVAISGTWTIFARAWYSSGTASPLVVELRQDSGSDTLIATLTMSSLTSSAATYSYNLSGAEVALVTAPNDLYFKVIPNDANNPSGADTLRVSQLFLRVPPSNMVLAGSTGLDIFSGPGWDIDGTVANNIKLTNGNKSATKMSPDVWKSVRGTAGPSGKRYFEVSIDAGASNGMVVGIASALPAGQLGVEATGYGYTINSTKYNNSVSTAYGASYTVGDVIGVAYDSVAATLEFYKNNVSQGVAYSTVTAATYYAAASFYYASLGAKVTGRFTNGDFSYAPPAGYLAWGTTPGATLTAAGALAGVTSLTFAPGTVVHSGWDPVAITGVTYSNGNKTATYAGAAASHVVASAIGKTTGKFYYEIQAKQDASGSAHIGVGFKSGATGGAYLGDNAAGFALFDQYTGANDERAWNNAAYVGYTDTVNFFTGARIGIAIDLGAGKGWIRRAGAWIGDPAAGTGNTWSWTPGGTFVPATDLYGGSNGTLYTNLADHNNSAPAGFLAEWGTFALPALSGTAALAGATSLTFSGGDPYFASVSSLLHFEGADTSTTFTDQKGKTWTAFNQAQIDTAQFKFGSASGQWDGASDYIETPSHTDFNFNFDSFTIECFVRPDLAADRSVISRRGTGANGWALEVRATGAVWLRAMIGGSWSDTQITTATGLVVAATWTHIALVRDGSNWTIYVGGTSSGTLTNAGTLDDSSSEAIRMGRSQSSSENDYSGHIDEMRVTKGVARYTANFTPPVAAFPDAAAGSLKGAGALAGATSFTFATAGVAAGAGALLGASPLTFAPASVLAGAGAMLGASPLVFDSVSVMAGAGALAGASSLTFASTSALSCLIYGASSFTFAGSATADAPSSAMEGSSSITFASTSVLVGAGALVGASPLVFATAGAATGAGALAGTAPGAFSVSAVLLGAGVLAGASSLTFASTSVLTGAGVLGGASALVFASTSVLTGAGVLAGASSLSFTTTSAATGAGALSGTVPGAFTVTATLLGAGALVGSAPLTFAATATPTIAGASSLAFGTAGVLAGAGVLVSTSSLTFAPTSVLTSTGVLDGASSLTFASTSVLAGAGALAGAVPGAFTVTAVLLGAGDMIGSTSVTFAPVSALSGAAAIAGASSLTFTGSLTSSPLSLIDGATSLTLAGNAALGGGVAAVGATALTLGAGGVLGGQAVAQATAGFTFTPAGNLLGTGSLDGASIIAYTMVGEMLGRIAAQGATSITFGGNLFLATASDHLTNVTRPSDAAASIPRTGSSSDTVPRPNDPAITASR